MTADEFREMLDRFHAALVRADEWSQKHGARYIETEWHLELDAVWRDLNRECALMKDAERRLITSKHPGMVQPTRPLPEPPLKPSEVNAEEIGTLQAHEISNLRCLVAHDDGHGNQQPPCIQCKRCGEYIRPEAMGQKCPGKPPASDGLDDWAGGAPPVADDRTVLADGSVPK